MSWTLTNFLKQANLLFNLDFRLRRNDEELNINLTSKH